MNPVDKVIVEIDAAVEPMTEHEVADKILSDAKDRPDLSREDRDKARADFIAFRFVGRLEGDSEWGTHFGPMMTGVQNNGEPFSIPSITEVTGGAVQHWRARSCGLHNPVLVARYADLAWDLARIGGDKPDPDDARRASDSYLASAAGRYKD